MTQELLKFEDALKDIEEKITETINNISELNFKMNQPEYSRNDIEIFVMNKKMEQESLQGHMHDKKQIIKKIKAIK